MVAGPLAAGELPISTNRAAVATPGVFDADAVNAQNHRRWYRRDRVDAGDVIGGLLVIGTIAAVASAASKAGQRNRDYRYPDRDYRYPDQRGDYRYDYRNRPTGGRWDDSRGLDRAVDMCAREVERNARIETIDSANRSGDGWDVSGSLRTGEGFRCTIGNDGRIRDVDYGRGFRGSDAVGAEMPAGDRQWDDDRYAAARAAQEGTQAYPDGPLPGDGEAGDDGRYETAQTPDFNG